MQENAFQLDQYDNMNEKEKNDTKSCLSMLSDFDTKTTLLLLTAHHQVVLFCYNIHFLY